MAQTPTATQYINTDLMLESATPFPHLHQELDQTCCVLSYFQGEDQTWYANIETDSPGNPQNDSAADDIRGLLQALDQLSATAKAELSACHLREFDMGFSCGDTWAYPHKLSPDMLQAIAAAHCSLAITLYPAGKLGDAT